MVQKNDNWKAKMQLLLAGVLALSYMGLRIAADQEQASKAKSILEEKGFAVSDCADSYIYQDLCGGYPHQNSFFTQDMNDNNRRGLTTVCHSTFKKDPKVITHSDQKFKIAKRASSAAAYRW